ncbi:MAG: DUF4079 domain-containing protein [Cyanobacteriota bacterium]|nr:DUF4079 domain-containing protein [Cyanobacteriota bacterium]
MNIAEILQPVAKAFESLGIPEPIVHWGHPAMMAIVLFVMGSFVGYAGWRGRLATDEGVAVENFSNHRKLAPFMTLFIFLGATGGILSLVMQGQDIISSPHFWTGSILLTLLAANGFISLTKFGGNKAALRTAHAYIGSLALAVMLVHAILGFKLGLAI